MDNIKIYIFDWKKLKFFYEEKDNNLEKILNSFCIYLYFKRNYNKYQGNLIKSLIWTLIQI